MRHVSVDGSQSSACKHGAGRVGGVGVPRATGRQDCAVGKHRELVLRPRERHRRDLPPRRRRLRHVDHPRRRRRHRSAGNRGSEPSRDLMIFPGRYIAELPPSRTARVDDAPGLRGEIQHAARDGILGGRRGEDACRRAGRTCGGRAASAGSRRQHRPACSLRDRRSRGGPRCRCGRRRASCSPGSWSHRRRRACVRPGSVVSVGYQRAYVIGWTSVHDSVAGSKIVVPSSCRRRRRCARRPRGRDRRAAECGPSRTDPLRCRDHRERVRDGVPDTAYQSCVAVVHQELPVRKHASCGSG